MSIQINIDADQTAFRPGDSISGTISWSLPLAPTQVTLEYSISGTISRSLPLPPTQLTLELFWTTRGKGIVDSEVVQSKQIKNPAPTGQERFDLTIPNGPYSFSGKLVSLLWGLRLIIHPSQEQTQVNLTISRTGQEINLVG